MLIESDLVIVLIITSVYIIVCVKLWNVMIWNWMLDKWNINIQIACLWWLSVKLFKFVRLNEWMFEFKHMEMWKWVRDYIELVLNVWVLWLSISTMKKWCLHFKLCRLKADFSFNYEWMFFVTGYPEDRDNDRTKAWRKEKY